MRRMRERVLDGATLGAAVVALALGGMVVWDRMVGASETSGDREIAQWEQYTERGHWMGPKNAPVTIVEWGDYQCPGCRLMAPRLEALRSDYPTEVAVLYRHWPLDIHSRSYPAARAAECAAAQGRFEAMHGLLNEDTEWGRAADVTGAFVELAERAEVSDLAAFRTCLVDEEPDAAIDADIAAVREIEARGTPALLINGVYPGSMPDSARLDALVREALGR